MSIVKTLQQPPHHLSLWSSCRAQVFVFRDFWSTPESIGRQQDEVSRVTYREWSESEASSFKRRIQGFFYGSLYDTPIKLGHTPDLFTFLPFLWHQIGEFSYHTAHMHFTVSLTHIFHHLKVQISYDYHMEGWIHKRRKFDGFIQAVAWQEKLFYTHPFQVTLFKDYSLSERF